MTYLKTLYLKIQCARDDISQVWIDLIFIMVPWGIIKEQRSTEHIITNIISEQK